MPEKGRSGQIALLIAGAVLVVVILGLIFSASPPGNGGKPSDEDARKARPMAKAAEPIIGHSKKRVEEKLARALSPETATNPAEVRKFYQPARPRTRLDQLGRVLPVTGPVENGEPLEIILGYLDSEEPGTPRDQGWTGGDFAEPVLMSSTRSRHNGVSHFYLRQQIDGIAVYNGDLNANIAKDGSILSLHNSFVKDAESRINRRDPVLSAAEAVEKAAEQVRAGVAVSAENLKIAAASDGPAKETVFEGGDLSYEPIPAKLVYVAQPDDAIRLAWNLAMHLKDGLRWLDLTIDAENGDLLTQANWYANADYRVFALPKEHPTDGPRTLESDPQDAPSSPFGWHDTNGVAGAEFNTTQGNNVHAQEDTDANNQGGRRPNGGPPLIFDNPLNLTQAPPSYESAAITNLFYWNNILHDILWHYGFDEASGNFQVNNYGNGGVAGDPVQADAQDGSGTNNANFATPPDGTDPRMQMFVWTQANPDRDSDLENGIIIHEYGHGISNRLTGGAANSSALNLSQSRGMGEGWSDWWALCLTAVAGDTATTPRGIGTYVLDQPVTGPGIRPYRYTTDMAVNPQTFGDLDDGGLSVPHGIGSVWCTTLWDVYWGLVAQHGWDPNFYTGTGGNNIAMQLVIDGMKLQPVNPTYLEARDAIILADQTNNGGANVPILWQAFAKRGMGFSADDGGSASSLNVTEAFDIPDEMISITDVTVTEGDAGTVIATFVVSLDEASDDEEIRVNYASENGSASQPGDYTPVSGQLTFPAGTTIRTVTVTVNGDTTPEEDEIFTIRLSDPINAVIADDAGVGTIFNDDYIPPVINSPLTAAGAEGIPFSYTIGAANTPRTFSISGGVPAGMTVDTGTGVVSWPDPVMGIYNINITAINPAGSDTESLAIDIAQNPLLTALDVVDKDIRSSAIPWFSQTAVTHDTVDAAQSGDVDDNESSWMELDVTGPDTVFFWWKVSSESNYDYLRLRVNGAINQEIDGEVDWQKVQVDLPAGNHTLRWEYDKDFSVSTGADAGWVDELVLLSEDPRPFITGDLTAFGARDQPFAYQIQTLLPATSFSSDPLPAGLTLNPSTGLISGTPTVGSIADVTITATNAAGSDSQTLKLVISETANFPFFDDFESGVLGPAWTISGTNEYRSEVTQSHGPKNGSWHLVMDDTLDASSYSRNEATLSIDLLGQTNVFLSFWARDYGDEPDGPPTVPFTNGADFDGVAISEDGVTWYEIQPLRDEVSSDWEQFAIDLDGVIATHGLAYNSNFKIRFNQYDNYSAQTDGIAIDDVTVGKITGTADLTDASDSGVSNSDNITNVLTPVFTGTAAPGASVSLSSNTDGDIGNGTANASGIWMITASSPLSEGIHRITALEGGGVPSGALTVTIDTTGPLPAINQAAGQPDATSETTLDFSAVFDEPVIGFESGDILLGGSLAGSVIVTLNEVAPNDGTTFNVEITGMPSDGTVTVSALEGIVTDRAGNPSQTPAITDNSITFRFPADPPTNVSATDGEFSDKIRVTWDPVPTADGGYRIYRHTADDFSGASQIGATLQGNETLNDPTAVTGTTYFYWVKSKRAFAGVGEESASDAGFRAEDEHGDTPGGATDIGALPAGNSSETGILENNDKDFFKFTLPWRTHVKIYTTGPLDTVGSLFEADGTTLANDPAEDDDARPDGHNFEIDEVLDAGEFLVRVAGAGNQSGPYELVFEIFGPLEFQPDRMIGANPGALIGDDFYSDSGAGQSQTMTSKKLRKTMYYGRVENDGNFPDQLTIQGRRGTRLFRIIYYDASGNVTAAMIAGTLVKDYEPDEGEATRILVKPSRKLKNRRTKRIKRKQIAIVITVISGMEGTRRDAVKALTKTR